MNIVKTKVGNRHKAKRSAKKKGYYTQYRHRYEMKKIQREKRRLKRLAKRASGERIESASGQKHRAKYARRKARKLAA